MHYREGQKLRRRNFPKGYAEMLEKQHNQLVGGLQKIYQRLHKGSLWEGEPLDESSGRPLTHDILAALNFLEAQEDGSDAEFIKQPRSSAILEGPDDDDDSEKTPAACSQEISQSTPNDLAVFFDSNSPLRSASSKSASSKAVSPTTASPNHLLGRPWLQPILPIPAMQSLPAVSSPIQLHALWDGPLYDYDIPQAALYDSSLDNTDWGFDPLLISPPVLKHVPGLSLDLSSHKRTASAPRPSLCYNWLGNGVEFDSSDFVSDFHLLSPQDTTYGSLPGPQTAGSVS